MDPRTAGDLTTILAGPVFAIAVASYLLVKIPPALDGVKAAIDRLTDTVARMEASVTELSRILPRRPE